MKLRSCPSCGRENTNQTAKYVGIQLDEIRGLRLWLFNCQCGSTYTGFVTRLIERFEEEREERDGRDERD